MDLVQKLKSSSALTSVESLASKLAKSWKQITALLVTLIAVTSCSLITPLGPQMKYSESDPNYPPIVDKRSLNKKQTDWNDTYTKAVLLNFDAPQYYLAKGRELENVDYLEILDNNGNLQRAFITIQNPTNRSENRLFEVLYQHFDDDIVNGKLNPTGTGFKTCFSVEHELKNQTDEEAKLVIDKISANPRTRRNLVKDEDNKTVFYMSLGGWCLEVGGGAHAEHMENGRLPLQWKNLLNVDGKGCALEECRMAAEKLGLKINPQTATFKVTSNSLGTPNGILATYLIKDKYNCSANHTVIAPMAYGQSLKQLTEIVYNLTYPGNKWQTLESMKGDSAKEAQALEIAAELNGNDTKIIASIGNAFNGYFIKGDQHNAVVNDAPALPGRKLFVVNFPDYEGIFLKIPSEHSFGGNSKKIPERHLLPGIEKQLRLGESSLRVAMFQPPVTLNEFFFDAPHRSPKLQERLTAFGLHTYHSISASRLDIPKDRDPITWNDAVKSVYNYDAVAKEFSKESKDTQTISK